MKKRKSLMQNNLYYYRAIVKRIIDGDTIVVDIDCGFDSWLHNISVRFNGINAPETKGESKVKRLESKDFVKSKIEDKEIIIRTTKSDKYGRLLANIYYLEDDKYIHLNQQLITEGLAIPYMVEE